MTPSHEEALRALRVADRDIAAFMKLRGDPDIHISSTCFHAQQAVEKCMKAVMFERAILFPPVHDLARLALILQERGINVPCLVDHLRKLNPFAVLFRYDDTDIPLVTTEEVEKWVERMREWAGKIVR